MMPNSDPWDRFVHPNLTLMAILILIYLNGQIFICLQPPLVAIHVPSPQNKCVMMFFNVIFIYLYMVDCGNNFAICKLI